MPLVRYVQGALAERDHQPGAVDGVFGARTRAALASFAGRRDADLTPEAIADLRGRTPRASNLAGATPR